MFNVDLTFFIGSVLSMQLLASTKVSQIFANSHYCHAMPPSWMSDHLIKSPLLFLSILRILPKHSLLSAHQV